MNIRKATASYETWLGAETALIAEHVAIKHEQMAAGPFQFLRATFYRWAQLWPNLAGDLAEAPKVLATGDLHVENFGTWRDAEGRLIWGVNDFDEAFELPCTFDLVRLAASVFVARAAQGVLIEPRAACQALLAGYTRTIHEGGRPFVLGEHHSWLSAVAHGELRNPISFWQRMRESPTATSPIPAGAKKALEQLMPEAGLPYHVVQRLKGLGSLGHRRFIALAEYRGGMIAREAKSLSPSACVWAWEKGAEASVRYEEILGRSIRCPDPMVHATGSWLARRIAPDCSRIELASLGQVGDEAKLLAAMGSETANIHLGTEGAARHIARDLKSRPRNWLRAAAKTMLKATLADWKEWRATQEPAPTNQMASIRKS